MLLLFIFSSAASADINSTNSPPIAAKELPSLFSSIPDIIKREAAKIPIAPAILSNVSALRFVCHASKQP